MCFDILFVNTKFCDKSMPALDKNQEMRNDYLMLTTGLLRRWWWGWGKVDQNQKLGSKL